MPRICVCLTPRPQVFRHDAFGWASQGNTIRLLSSCGCPRAPRRSMDRQKNEPPEHFVCTSAVVAARGGSTSVLRYPRLPSAVIRAWRVAALPAGSWNGKAPAKVSVLRIDGKACMTRVVMATPQAHPPPWAGTVARDGARAQAPTATPRGSLDGSPPPRHWSA